MQQIIVHGFRHAGIFDALGILDKDELPRYSSEEDSDIEENNTVVQGVVLLCLLSTRIVTVIHQLIHPIVLSSSEDNTSTSP